ncbi:MAG TPA: TonB-dependent receptor [Burkholderiales bacterium]|nr:TonB-dependent receptor [Burkholderiales bacterium]
MNIRIIATAAAALLFSSSHAAETPISVAPEVVVTATRLPQYQTQSLRPATVITAADIEHAGQQSLVEVLQSLGGVEVSSTGGFGQPASVFMRGANSAHTLVLVDGMRVNSATTGTAAFENIPVNQVERIEIVPGPLSGVYGSDAIGGVIQIFTKGARAAPGFTVTAGAGRYHTRSIGGGINSVKDNTEFSLHFGYFESDGFDATRPTIPFGLHNPDRDGYRNTNLSGKIAQHFGEDHELGVMLFHSDGATHFDSGPATDDVTHQTLSTFSIYSRNRLTRNWQSLVRVGQGEDNLSVTGATPGSFRTRQPQVTWQNDIRLGYGTVVAGVEYLEQNITSDTAYTQTSRTMKSAFAGYSGEYGGHLWQVNARDDHNSQFGNHQTGALGYGYRITPAWKIRANAGTAFKAPTFNDLYFPGFSNPNLRPERSRSREIGVDYQRVNHRFSATYFENRISDLIVFDLATFLPQNLSQARIRGTQLSYAGTVAGYDIRAQVTSQDPVDESTGKRLPRRAREHGSVSLTKAIGAWRGGTEVVASGARFDSSTEDPATRMHGYALLNLVADYAVNREWRVKARWNNVTNRDYQLAQHFNTPGSNLFVALQYQPR